MNADSAIKKEFQCAVGRDEMSVARKLLNVSPRIKTKWKQVSLFSGDDDWACAIEQEVAWEGLEGVFYIFTSKTAICFNSLVQMKWMYWRMPDYLEKVDTKPNRNALQSTLELSFLKHSAESGSLLLHG